MSWVVEIDERIMLMAELCFVILGLIIGSFLNVCIARIPCQESIVFPNSHCPHCGNPIKAYDNIPLLSYLLLLGKCRSCGQRISWQYPAVEALTALTFWVTFVLLGFNLKAIILLVFFSSIIILIFIDLNHRILPDVITLPGVLFGLLFSLLTPVQDSTAEFILSSLGLATSNAIFISFINSFLGVLICGGFLWLVAEIFFRVRKMEGLGFGDIKLMGMVGAFLGMKLALLTIMLGSMMGAVIGLLFIKLAGKDARYELPFGSFLGIAAIISALWGHRLISDYARTLHGS